MTHTSFAHSNLSGVDLSGAILVQTNFWQAALSGVDFSVISNASIFGSTFIESNLSNSNFEGIDLGSKQKYNIVFENKAYLKNLPHVQVVRDLWGDAPQVFILSLEVRGNDLAVEFVLFNSFARANLENTNFRNTILWNANFNEANLTNADFSGADLRSAFLGGADLSNANLSGADISGAYIDESTIVKCINHPVCLD